MSNATKPCFIMVQLKFANLEESIQRYGQYAVPIINKYGGQMIAGTATPSVLEGDWAGNWAAVLQFPSKEAALEFYHSDDYRPFKELRINELQSEAGTVVITEGLVEIF
jgi:uncharacterized protein (DUF1330 family)